MRPRAVVLSVAVTVAAAAGIVGYLGTSARRQKSSPPIQPSIQSAAVSTQYAEPSACASCHEEIARTYAMTGMGRSFTRLGAGAELATLGFPLSGDLYHKASDRHYGLFARDGRLYQRRHQLGFGGSATNIVELSADYVVGSGNHARTFLHRQADGRLVQLPVSWYAEGGGYWAMSPGYDKPAHLDFRRLINDDCMSCHNGYPRTGLQDEGNGPRFIQSLPEGIDCQRCHGPGQNHIDSVRAGSIDAARRAIANPGGFNRERQLDTCMQCHLETTSSPLPFRIRRYERQPFSYVPGEPLTEHFLYFDHAPGSGRDDKFEIASAAYRLRKSACFLRSSMTCTTCHDPHNVLRGEAAVKHHVAVCQSCHSQVHRSGVPRVEGIGAAGTCIACHMPKRRAEDAVHVVMTDHFIRRRPGVAGLGPLREVDALAETYRGEVVPYYLSPLPASSDSDLYVALAQVQEGSNLPAGIARLEQLLAGNSSARPEFYYELARAYGRASDDASDIRWCQEAIRRDPTFASAFKELAAAATRLGDFPRAAGALEAAVRIRPRDAVALADLGNVYLQQGRVDASQQALKQALAIDAISPRANNTMGLAMLRTGAIDAAETYFRAAIQIQPDLAEAQNNLGNLLAGRKAYAEAAFHFDKAIKSDPAYTAAHHSYGLVLALSGTYDAAVEQLRLTLQLDPRMMQAHLDLGDVLSSMGRRVDAAREYQAALQSVDAEIRREAQASLDGLRR